MCGGGDITITDTVEKMFTGPENYGASALLESSVPERGCRKRV
jgi:hypothetical protein